MLHKIYDAFRAKFQLCSPITWSYNPTHQLLLLLYITHYPNTHIVQDAFKFSDTTSKFNVVSMFVTVHLQCFYGWLHMPDSSCSLNVAWNRQLKKIYTPHLHICNRIRHFDVITSLFSGYMFGGWTTAHRHTRTLLRTVIRAPFRMTSLLGEGDYI